MVTNDEHINDILALHFSGEKLTEEQENDLVDWICDHKSEYKRLSALMDTFPVSGGIKVDSEKAWEMMSKKMNRKISLQFKPVLRYVSYAACVVLIAGISLIYFNKQQVAPFSYKNTTENLMAVMLPDSSSVTLYPNSQITYQSDNASAERKSTLEGKAFFKVKRNPDQPFVVDHRNTEVRVLGTSFLVDGTGQQETSVYVRDGRVQVSAMGQHVVLTESEKAHVSGKGIEKGVIESSTNFFRNFSKTKSYKNEPLINVLNDIELEFKVKIDADKSFQTTKITTTLNFEKIDDLLEEISYICNVKFKKLTKSHYNIEKL